MTSTPNKFAYFGTPYVARDTLAILIERGFRPTVVVTSPDAPKGRGLALTPSDTRVLAEKEGIPVLAPEKLDAEAQRSIAAYGCNAAIVVAYGKILPQSLIDQFSRGVLNIHYSLLPKYRGASPVEAALLNDEATTGVSIQKMVFRLDAGDVLAQQEVAIEPSETTRELRARLVVIGAELLAKALPTFLDGTATYTPQDEDQATHVGKIDKSDGELSLAGDARMNWNKYRAYAEWPGTYFFAERNGKRIRVKITKASLSPAGAFVVERVIPEGKREMAYADFARA
jgi:methionyl-tRNA formyltransferase